ncbi:transposase, partial [Microcoleus sp. Pol14C2]|uniref:transposase n=1 Tax=unclassified Microcoleus TaxID=2642155 RepID=UPI002FD4B396
LSLLFAVLISTVNFHFDVFAKLRCTQHYPVAAMPYYSSLTDSEWETIEPRLHEILPKNNRNRPCNWTKREILDGIFYQLKNGCNWQDLPKDLPPYSTVDWHYK